jgi:hypothetical protein
MGVRVNKVIGYGLTDVEFKESGSSEVLCDPRFRKDGYVAQHLTDYDAAEDTYSVKAWRKFLTAKWKTRNSLKRKTDRFHVTFALEDEKRAWERELQFQSFGTAWTPKSCFEVFPDCGDVRYLIFVPPTRLYAGREDWKRYDDTLDWVEETEFHEQEWRVQTMRWRPIPPYDTWIDSRTGKHVTSNARQPDPRMFAEICSDNKPWWRHKTSSEKRSLLCRYNAMAKTFGFSTIREAREYMIPEIPMGIQLFCEFGKIFKNPKTIRDLRPMFAVYWW